MQVILYATDLEESSIQEFNMERYWMEPRLPSARVVGW